MGNPVKIKVTDLVFDRNALNSCRKPIFRDGFQNGDPEVFHNSVPCNRRQFDLHSTEFTLYRILKN